MNLPEDGVAKDLFTIDFPPTITSVHFIKLRLLDDKVTEVVNNFYWRSNSHYEGLKTLTGPTTSGFQDLSKLKQTKLEMSYREHKEEERYFIDIEVKNTSHTIAFFTQLQLLDENDKPIRPSFYSDNFFSLLPGERKAIRIETNARKLVANSKLILKGWNVKIYNLRHH